MNKKVIVLIDLDDTMTHLVRAWCQWLNHRHGTKVTEDNIIGWKIADYFPELTERQVFEPVHMDVFWKDVEPMEGAQKYIKLLIDEGFDIYVCTASSFDTIKSKFEYVLGRHFPFISWNRVIVTKNKQLVNGHILIDDGVHNLEGGAYKKILMSAPHNKSYDAESNGMTRVETWKEAYDAVHTYASKILREDSNYESN
jgi:5'-nucleotidase